MAVELEREVDRVVAELVDVANPAEEQLDVRGDGPAGGGVGDHGVVEMPGDRVAELLRPPRGAALNLVGVVLELVEADLIGELGKLPGHLLEER